MDTYETSIYTAVLITALVLGCIIVYFAFSVFRQQRKYIKMQRRYFTEEINLLEKERTRVARDLHDELGPMLSLTKTHIGLVTSKDEKESYHLEKTNEHLGILMKRMGQIAVNLTPTSLERRGLQFSLESFLKELEAVSEMDFQFQYEVGRPLKSEQQLNIYRIVQEIAHNCIKHAEAKNLRVHLKERKSKLYIFCKDDGIGFRPEPLQDKRTGLGLRSLQSRTEMLGGKMKMVTGPGKGTEYFFELPIDAI